jgi:hypothetical protein
MLEEFVNEMFILKILIIKRELSPPLKIKAPAR